MSGHSHLDGFWLQTYDEYYNGNGNDGVHRWINVKKMFSQVIKGLSQDPKRTHALAEIAYFKRWFLDASE
jgi:hypothetical protein